MTAVGLIRSIVLECADPEPIATFWSDVLGLPVAQQDDDWWALERPSSGPRMAFQVVDAYEPPAWPGQHGEQQVHLDIEVDDLTAAVTRVLELGARQLSDVIDEDGSGQWQVFADPSGHPFCLVS
jgi:catechol 2,3-dioxygenase-like lactoylglutathione lyase family enzyme